MLGTWLLIIIIGNSAQSIEMASMQDCLEFKQYLSVQIEGKEELKGKVALGCFKNMGERSHDS